MVVVGVRVCMVELVEDVVVVGFVDPGVIGVLVHVDGLGVRVDVVVEVDIAG